MSIAVYAVYKKSTICFSYKNISQLSKSIETKKISGCVGWDWVWVKGLPEKENEGSYWGNDSDLKQL